MKGTSPSRGRGEVNGNGIMNRSDGQSHFHQNHPDEKDISIMTLVIDIGKNILAVHGVNKSGNAGLVKPKIHDQWGQTQSSFLFISL